MNERRKNGEKFNTVPERKTHRKRVTEHETVGMIAQRHANKNKDGNEKKYTRKKISRKVAAESR